MATADSAESPLRPHSRGGPSKHADDRLQAGALRAGDLPRSTRSPSSPRLATAVCGRGTSTGLRPMPADRYRPRRYGRHRVLEPAQRNLMRLDPLGASKLLYRRKAKQMAGLIARACSRDTGIPNAGHCAVPPPVSRGHLLRSISLRPQKRRNSERSSTRPEPSSHLRKGKPTEDFAAPYGAREVYRGEAHRTMSSPVRSAFHPRMCGEHTKRKPLILNVVRCQPSA